MREGERQVAPTRDGIRRDHLARYEEAVRMLGDQPRTVLDVACGIGYGSQLLAEAGHTVTAVDCDQGALEYAQAFYKHERLTFKLLRAENIDALRTDDFDVAIMFEAIEHIADPLPVLRALREKCGRLLASVPNEAVFPWKGHAYHFRHYTPEQFEALLNEAGWRVTGWMTQDDQQSDLRAGKDGWTIVAQCEPGERVSETPKPQTQTKKAPETVAILGLGPSVAQYLDIAKRLGARAKLADEVWGINALGDVLKCDRVFHMDDVRVQEIRAKEAPDSNIAAMLGWLKTYDGIVYTSIAHPDYPATVAYPLEDVLNSLGGTVYFNSTAAYAVALAIHLGVKKINLFGIDFTYPDAHDAEKGRGCVEFWLGYASARGIKIATAKTSSLLDAYASFDERVYGYDCVDVRVQETGGKMTVALVPRDTFPTAEEIEARYDHSKHPNALVDPE